MRNPPRKSHVVSKDGSGENATQRAESCSAVLVPWGRVSLARPQIARHAADSSAPPRLTRYTLLHESNLETEASEWISVGIWLNADIAFWLLPLIPFNTRRRFSGEWQRIPDLSCMLLIAVCAEPNRDTTRSSAQK